MISNRLPRRALLFFLISVNVWAQDAPRYLGAPDIISRAAVLMDAATGTVLYAKNPDEEIPPASLTKLMTIHLALTDTANGRTSLDNIVELPRQSWAINQPPRSSLMFLAPGQRVSLGELLLGLAVSSGNDAAVAVALHLAPSVEAFAGRMNAEAARLAMDRTVFVEPSGISEYNITTAIDFARFCRLYLSFHPETLAALHSVREFAYPKAENVDPRYRDNPETIVQYNRNTMIRRYSGVDGLKTGYIDEAGYNIALTAERDGTRFIAVILGAPADSRNGERIRNEDSAALLDWGYGNFKTLRPVLPALNDAPAWKAREKNASLMPGYPLIGTVRRERGEILSFREILDGPVIAPLEAGTPVGSLAVLDADGELFRIPLLLANNLEQGSIFRRAWDSIRLFFRGLTGG